MNDDLKPASSQILGETKEEFERTNVILEKQLLSFSQNVAPYLAASKDISPYVYKDSTQFLNGMAFFRLKSCTIEKTDDAFTFINERIEKLFTALYALESPVLYGIISREGKANIVLGVNYESKIVVNSIIRGLLTGIELEEDQQYDFTKVCENPSGGFACAVPILKVEEEKQRFDFSTLMKSLNGKTYTVLFYSVPAVDAQQRYASVLNIKDACFAVSKRNVSRQHSVNDSKTTTQTTTTNTRGVVQELANQVVREKRVDFKGLLDAFIDSGVRNVAEAIGTATTVEGITSGTSFDIQNGMALELIEYCDKAIERLKYGQASGLWKTSISFSATDEIDLKILKSCLLGELAKPSADIMPLAQFDYPSDNKQAFLLPSVADPNNPLFVPVTTKELSIICTPPSSPVPYFEIKTGKFYPMIPSQINGTVIGSVTDGQRPLDNLKFSLSDNDLNKHTFICGITGSGKTTTVKGILNGADKPYLVLESAKKEYRNISGIDSVYTLGKPEINCIQMNPFYVQYGINLQTHIDFLKDLFNASFSLYGPMPYILEKCLGNIYKRKGWNLTLGYHPLTINLSKPTSVFEADYIKKQYALRSCDLIFPTIQDLKDEVKRYIEKDLHYEGEVAGNIKSAILSRLESLCVGSKGFMFNTHKHLDMSELMEKKVVFELEGLADDSDKAFCVGLLVVFINEYRQIAQELDNTKGLKHLLVIEEAHRLLKNVETEKFSENVGNPKGKAVEHFTNMIAEMRSYGQGVIIAEQIPSKLAPEVIKNSSNKIVQRIVSGDDQAIIANTIGINAEDAVHLGSLKSGYALCHCEGMSLPVLVAVNDCQDTPKKDDAIINSTGKDPSAIFDSINEQMITESISSVLDSLAFKMLNTIMVSEDNTIANYIRGCRDVINFEVRKKGVTLLPMDSNRQAQVFGKIIAERIMEFLNNSVYSFGYLVPDDLFSDVETLCIKGRSEFVQPVKTKLKLAYKRECEAQCLEIIPNIIKLNSKPSMNIEKTIQGYFFNLPDAVFAELLSKTKEMLAQ